MARKTYTREFELQAVQMMADPALPVAEVGRRLGVRENLLRNWKTAATAGGPAAFPGAGHLTPADDELRRLRAEVTRPRAERDLLKKAAAYVARPPARRSGSSPSPRASGRSPGRATPWTCPSPGPTPGPPAPRPGPSGDGMTW